jgi:hypothetical protein
MFHSHVHALQPQSLPLPPPAGTMRSLLDDGEWQPPATLLPSTLQRLHNAAASTVEVTSTPTVSSAHGLHIDTSLSSSAPPQASLSSQAATPASLLPMESPLLQGAYTPHSGNGESDDFAPPPPPPRASQPASRQSLLSSHHGSVRSLQSGGSGGAGGGSVATTAAPTPSADAFVIADHDTSPPLSRSSTIDSDGALFTGSAPHSPLSAERMQVLARMHGMDTTSDDAPPTPPSPLSSA